MGDSSAQDPEEITSCPAHILLPPILPHLFPLSLGGFSTGQEELTPFCARSHSDVEWGLRDLPTQEQPALHEPARVLRSLASHPESQ